MFSCRSAAHSVRHTYAKKRIEPNNQTRRREFDRHTAYKAANFIQFVRKPITYHIWLDKLLYYFAGADYE